MRKKVLLSIGLLLIFTVCGCDSENKNNQGNKYYETKEEAEIQKYNGVYEYEISSSTNNVTSSGYFVIDGKNCYSKLGIMTKDDYPEEQNIKANCSSDGSNIIIDPIESIGTYKCLINGKNLNCNPKYTYGFTYQEEPESSFIYRYTKEEFNEYYKSYSLNLPEKLKWEMSAAETKDVFKTKGISTYSNFNTKFSSTEMATKHIDSSYGLEIEDVSFWFWEDKLAIYDIRFENKPSQPFESYEKVKEFFVKKYGNPNIEDYKWSNDNYKNDNTKINEAMKYDYLVISTVWNLNDYHVYINWDYNKEISVEYVKNGYEEYR